MPWKRVHQAGSLYYVEYVHTEVDISIHKYRPGNKYSMSFLGNVTGTGTRNLEQAKKKAITEFRNKCKRQIKDMKEILGKIHRE